MTKCTLIANDSRLGSGLFSSSAVDVTRCTIRDNWAPGMQAGRDGGGPYNNIGAQMTPRDCRVTDKTADKGGVGIYNLGPLTLHHTIVRPDNEAGAASSISPRHGDAG